MPTSRKCVFFPHGFSDLVRSHAPNVPTSNAQVDAERTVSTAARPNDTDQAVGHDPHPSEVGAIVFADGEHHAYAPGAEWLGAFPQREAAQRALDVWFGRPVTAVKGSGFRLRPRVIGGRVADVDAFVGWLAEMATGDRR